MSYEIAEEYNKQYNALVYPEMPKRPQREAFPNHKAFGAAMDEWEAARSKCNEERDEYDRQSAAITQGFKQALGEEYGVINHPKFGRCWEIAWEHGHSSGYSEVAGYFAELAELLQPEKTNAN